MLLLARRRAPRGLAPHGPDGPIYSGLCRDLGESERAERRLLGREPSLRVRMEGPSGDIVVRRGDGVVAYQLAVVVDDAHQGVTHVVRGADLADSTARQLELYRLLSLEPVPEHAHVPLLLGPDGERLAKRHGAVGLAELRAQGADPRALTGWLAHSAGLLERARPCAPAELVERFDPSLT